MTKKRFRASRRDILLGLSTIGVASLGAGIGSYAAFTDREQTSTVFTAGGLDLTVHHETNYNGNPVDIVDSGTIDGEPSVLFELPDVKPGDSGRTRFCFELEGNPAYLWLCGALTANAEMGRTAPEKRVDTSGGNPGAGKGELATAVEVELKYADMSGNASTTITSGTLHEVLETLSDGIPLDGAESEGLLESGTQAAFTPSDSDEKRIEPCLVFEWTIRESVGNEIQTDRVEFGLTFYAQQARHSDGTNNPCRDDTRDDGTNGDEDTAPQNAISFVAFGVDEGALSPADVTELAVTEPQDGDEPLGISWATSTEIDRVVVKAGPEMENFPGGTSGTATVGDGEPGNSAQTPSDPYPDGDSLKFERGENNEWVTGE